MNNSKISPYAAPNTPIASTKRPRTSNGSLQKEVKNAPNLSLDHNKLTIKNTDSNCATNSSNPKTTNISDTNLSSESTPSKNLFSPYLRKSFDENDRISENSEERNMEANGDGVDDLEENEEMSFNPYSFMAGLPEHSVVVEKEKICLPPSKTELSKRPTLVLDLDETLVHCTVEPIPQPDLLFPVCFNGITYQVYVKKRPYLDYFLQTVSENFEVVIFTASQKVYADVLLNQIDPERKLIQYRLFREACLLVQGNYLKDLTVLGRRFEKTVLVDNSPHAYSYQIDNGIPIESWYDDDNDTELLKLIGFLRRVLSVEDVRPLIREHFKTYQLIANAKLGLPTKLSAPPF